MDGRANNYKQDVVRIPGSSKDPRCYDPQLVGFDSGLQAMCQLDVRSRNVLNKSLFPYIDQFAKKIILWNMNFRKTIFILSGQPIEIQKRRKDYPNPKTIYTSPDRMLPKTVTEGR